MLGANSTWDRLGPGDWDSQWPVLGGRLLALLVAGQQAAVADAAAHVPQVLGQLGIRSDPVAELVPGSLVGVASDGRELDSLLYEPVIRTRTAIAGGATTAEGLRAGRDLLIMIVQTQIADAARVAAGVGVATRPGVGYVRMLNPPSCSRCTVLAGRFYRWNDGFLRHPRCDCRHIPATENIAGDLRTDLDAYFRLLSLVE